VTTHLYCVLPHALQGAVPAGLSGLFGAPVRALPVEGIVAWVSDVERGLPLSFEGVRAHDAVVDAALATGTTPVPIRFGQRFNDDEACRSALANRSASLQSLLTTVDGYVEMTLLLTPSTQRMLNDLQSVLPDIAEETAESGSDHGPGRRYLDTLRSRESTAGVLRRALDELLDRLAMVFAPFVHRTIVHEQVMRMPMRTVSHLIKRADIDAYREAAQSVELGARRESRFLLIGPRAPYSFCASSGEGRHGMKLAD
jgi:Gas vesicle synthesis protein GvpL/GvpF